MLLMFHVKMIQTIVEMLKQRHFLGGKACLDLGSCNTSGHEHDVKFTAF